MDVEEFASVGEDATKGTTVADYNEDAHSNFQKNLLEQKTSELMGMDIGNGNTDNKLGEITHGG